ncbi:MAG: 5-formyltetrahydrofolate cyclo-ligase [Thermomicrobiales bacterium]|nr:5-formyltetrahydrofolate cyclo-ligase [Thermomicrobiales bacterium]
MKTFFSRIGRIGFGGSYLDRYYQGVVGRGAGYPTIDEARKDYQRVIAQRTIPRSM